MKVLTIGGATQDIFLCCKQNGVKISNSGENITFKCGSKIEISSLEYFTGGGSTNSAVSFKRLGLDVECFCKIGDDSAGKLVLDKLEAEDIITKKIVITKESNTGKSFVIGNDNGEQTVFVHRGVNKELRFDEVPQELIKSCDYLYITSLGGDIAEHLPEITHLAKNSNVKVALNPGSSQIQTNSKALKDSLGGVNIFILNKCEAKVFHEVVGSSPFSIENYAKNILDMGPEIVVITDGASGVWVATSDDLMFHPAMKVKVVGSLGAGDSFGSTFVGNLALGNNISDALRSGIINSASVISHIGTKNGLLSIDQLKSRLEKLDKFLLKKSMYGKSDLYRDT